ncbi:MAG: Isopentenyl-diphosphate Delta-isomerase [Candidatus Saccharibacteria bacterium]|nr:Isopentenyl-diphosphate Delta-isomerase [Candidatus Saccharibacteria bacterium]
MSQHPPILIVDESDNPTGAASMSEAHEEGMWHRIVFVMVEDESGNVLLQKRGPGMATYPNCWDVSAAGHVDQGEDYHAAALRELHEELGIKSAQLIEVGTYRSQEIFEGRKLNRFNKAYKLIVPKDIALQPQQSEVAELRWFGAADVTALMTEHPNDVASGLVAFLERYHA